MAGSQGGRTVFVVGAGASAELNLPLGETLKDEIASALDISSNPSSSETPVRSATLGGLDLLLQSKYPFDANPYATRDGYASACHAIRRSMSLAGSIDSFVESHAGNVHIEHSAKLAIASVIMGAECSSTLAGVTSTPNGPHFGRVRDSWLVPLFRLMVTGCASSAEDLKARLSKYAFVVFNYDRSLEHFMYLALQQHAQLTDRAAAEVVNSMNIFHPYGHLGPLPWQIRHEGEFVLDFGTKPDASSVFDAGQRLRTFSEGTEPSSSSVEDIRTHVALARQIVFLGFAFHDMNVEVLSSKGFSAVKGTNPLVLGTAYRISEPNREHICSTLRECLGVPGRADEVELRDLMCSEFLDEYSRVLSSA